MNWDQIEGNWRQLKGRARQKWGELTDDDLDRISGKRDELVGLIQEKYGKAREAAEQEVELWHDQLHDTEERVASGRDEPGKDSSSTRGKQQGSGGWRESRSGSREGSR